MTEPKIGCARVSTLDQDLTAQREALAALGVDAKRIYVDHGLTGSNRDRPGLRQALAAWRSGDTFVVTKPDRLTRVRSGRTRLRDLAGNSGALTLDTEADGSSPTSFPSPSTRHTHQVA